MARKSRKELTVSIVRIKTTLALSVQREIEAELGVRVSISDAAGKALEAYLEKLSRGSTYSGPAA